MEALALSGHKKALLAAEPDEVLSAARWTGVNSHRTSSVSIQGLSLLLVHLFSCDCFSKVLLLPSTKPEPQGSSKTPLASCRAQAESGNRGAVGLPVLSWCFRGSQSAGYLGNKLVRLQGQLLLGFCACCTSRLHATAWTSWGWDPDTSDAWGMSPTECLAWCQPRAPAACRKYWTFWVLKREPGTVPRLHLIHLLGATEKGVRGSLQK